MGTGGGQDRWVRWDHSHSLRQTDDEAGIGICSDRPLAHRGHLDPDLQRIQVRSARHTLLARNPLDRRIPPHLHRRGHHIHRRTLLVRRQIHLVHRDPRRIPLDLEVGRTSLHLRIRAEDHVAAAKASDDDRKLHRGEVKAIARKWASVVDGRARESASRVGEAERAI